MATLEELVGPAAGNAQLAHEAHAEVVELVMASIDLVALVMRGEARPDVAGLRPHVGKLLRRAQVKHSLALAALALESAPEYADQLMDYAESIPVSDQEGGA